MRILREPMLAPSKPLSDQAIATLQYPLYVSDKEDGIRMLTFPSEGGLTRSFKELPNKFLRMVFHNLIPPYLDGELLCGPEWTFGSTSSGAMSYEGTPEWKFLVFDCFKHPERPWKDRIEEARDLVEACNPLLDVSVINQALVEDHEQLLALEHDAVARGKEGVMVRCPNAPYKQGRSTIKEQYLLKIKRHETAEATIVGFNELMENRNVQERSNTGKAKRSTRSEGKIPAGMLGSFICQSPEFEYTFNVGGGLTDLQRRQFWNERHKLLSELIHYKHTPHGQKDRPRSTVFKGIRSRIDL